MTNDVTPITPEQWEAWRHAREHHVSEFLEKRMADAGIEGLEDLHRRFVETEYADLPFPGRHRGKPISFDLFERLATGRHQHVRSEFLRGLVQAFGLKRDSEEATEFIRAYLMEPSLKDFRA